ncbi:MAG TPA: nitrilase-related carbon-nitrogen hydrolase, partial [Rubricoccaceae bacterium]
MPKPPPAARPRLTRPFRSFGWALAGILGLSLSLPPVGFYPLAWVGLAPFLVRWSEHRTAAVCARETYALMLTLTACTGFWLLFHADTLSALAGGFGLLVVPLPFVAAVTLAGVVRRRFGLVLGVVALVLSVLASEYLLLVGPVDVPWLLLGHTQVEAVPFIQTADLGGVLLLSFWVLLLNVAAFSVIPAAAPGKGTEPTFLSRVGESGVAVAFFAVLVALPAAYGAARSAWTESPAGYTRLGVVQPGVGPDTWDAGSGQRVDVLASLSDRLLGRWTAADSADARAGGSPLVQRVSAQRGRPGRAGRPSVPDDINLLVWPQGALPYMGTDERERELVARLGRWCTQRRVALITGATTVAAGDGTDDEGVGATSALLVVPGRPMLRHDQVRRVPVADAPAVLGERRTLFPVGGARVAPLLGFESLFGDHARRFAADGADLFVVLAQSDRWGRSSGLYQHLHMTRLRAVETRRAVVVASVGGVSALVLPSGQIDETAGWMEQ